MLADITEKCIEAGISEKNIFSVTEAESAERYLEIAGISYVIIDASLYNYVIASVIEKFSDYFPIQVIITNSKSGQKTIRMVSNKTLTYTKSIKELADFLSKRDTRIAANL
jgi:hypothetical protein